MLTAGHDSTVRPRPRSSRLSGPSLPSARVTTTLLIAALMAAPPCAPRALSSSDPRHPRRATPPRPPRRAPPPPPPPRAPVREPSGVALHREHTGTPSA